MSSGKRAGSRRGPRQKSRPRLAPILYAAGATLAIIGWGYLVWMAIDFGSAARSGSNARWALLAVAAVGAMCCLFAALMLVTRMLRELGIVTAPPTPTHDPTGDSDELAPPPPPGGRRRA